MPKSADNPPSPSRPFLRRQESHSVVPANNAVFAHKSPSPSRPFLRRQESHNKRRQRRVESAAGGMPIVAQNKAKIHPQLPFPTGPFLRRQESLSHGRHRRLNLRRRWRHMVVRFLPTQEWSVGGTGGCGRILRGELRADEGIAGVFWRRIRRIGNNAGDNNAKIRRFPRSSTGPFLRKQESHNTGGNAASPPPQAEGRLPLRE